MAWSYAEAASADIIEDMVQRTGHICSQLALVRDTEASRQNSLGQGSDCKSSGHIETKTVYLQI